MLDLFLSISRTTPTSCDASSKPNVNYMSYSARARGWSVAGGGGGGGGGNDRFNLTPRTGGANIKHMMTEHRDLLQIRRPCEDQRGPLEHLRPPQLVKGAIRVTLQQSATIFSNYMNDQLKQDMKRDEKVQNGEMTAQEAEEEAEEWSEKEWPKRWEGFPAKLITAYTKYHAVTAVMRFYEFFASRRFDMVQMDKLTLDTFAAARRREKVGESASMLQVAQECWTANLISYLADYTVHQIILAFGYYVYIRDRQKRLSSQKGNSHNNNNNHEKDVELHAGSLTLSFLKKSTVLAFSRIVCLAFASLGGAIGSVLMPGGWGTLMGINMGDGMGVQITEEFVLMPPSHSNDSAKLQ